MHIRSCFLMVFFSVFAHAQTVRYVDGRAPAGGAGTSWASAYRYLQDALAAAAQAGAGITEIRVAAGTYTPDRGGQQLAGDRSAAFQLRSGLTIAGGYAGIGSPDPDARDVAAYPTLLSGDVAGNDRPGFTWNDENSYHVLTAAGTDATAVVEGFTITGGYANGTSTGSNNQGAGLLITSGGGTLRQCTFTRCKSSSYGPAVAQLGIGALALSDCTIVENAGQNGAVYTSSAPVELTRCRVVGNGCWGVYTGTRPATLKDCWISDNLSGGFYGGYASGTTLNNCTITRNLGTGISLSAYTASISNCVVSNNRAQSGAGGLHLAGLTNITNCDIAGNSTLEYGGGINVANNRGIVLSSSRIRDNRALLGGGGINFLYNATTTQSISNCLIVGNAGGAISNYGATCLLTHCVLAGNGVHPTTGYGSALAGTNPTTVTNCIVWGNASPAITAAASNFNITYCDIEGGYAGVGNISIDPGFAVPGDYHLLPGSPCIDAGTTSIPAGTPAGDYEDIARPQDGNGDTSALPDMGAYESVAGLPRLATSPNPLTVQCGSGDAGPVTAALTIANSGSGVLTWEAGDQPAWLSLTPAAGQVGAEPGQISVRLDPAGLPTGDYGWDLELVATGSTKTPVRVPVRLRVGRTLSVPAEYLTIQEAVNAAADGDTVLLAPGVYYGPGNRAIDLLGKAITLRGAPAHASVIDCQNMGRAFYLTKRETSATVVEGLRITHTVASNWDGGVYVSNGSPTFRDCVLEDGGGFYLKSANVTLSGCVIRNTDLYAVQSENSSVTASGCLFEGNSRAFGYYGSGTSWGTLTLSDCTFVGNTSGINWTGPLTADGCRFGSNSGGVAVTLSAPEQASFRNCWFHANNSYSGGAISISGGSGRIVNCTMVGNKASSQGGALYVSGAATVSLFNSILWANTAGSGPQIALSTYSGKPTLTVDRCDVEGGQGAVLKPSGATLNWGSDNIAGDPLFLDADGMDNLIATEDDSLRLMAGSPCLDAGDNALLAGLSTDIDGGPRIVGNAVDLGAYEQSVLLAPAGGVVVPEGATVAFTVRLAWEPSEPVSLNVAPVAGLSDADISVASGAILTFTPSGGVSPWDVPQTVTLEAAPDADGVNGKAIIGIEGPDHRWSEMAVQEADSTPSPAIFVDDDAAPGGDGATWATAFNTLQDALSFARTPDGRAFFEIWVAAGVYRPDRGKGKTLGDRAASFALAGNLALYGGFVGGETAREQRDPAINVCLLSGDLEGNDGPGFSNIADNTSNIVTASGTDSSAILDGFTVEGATGGSPGGAMYVTSGSPTVANCTFRGSNGRGFYCSQSSPVLTNCRFIGNNSGGVYADGSSNNQITMIGCEVRSNVSPSGAGVYVRGRASLTDCRILANKASTYSGGGVMADRATLVNCTISGNSAATAGGGLTCEMSSAQVTLVNCVLTGNSADSNSGGAIAPMFASSWNLVNCTIARNRAKTAGGGIGSDAAFTGQMAISNCVVWGNQDASGTTYDSQISGRSPTLSHSCVQGWTSAKGGIKNTGADPRLRNVSGPDGVDGTDDDNLRLGIGSSCFDAGDNSAVPSGILTDFTGAPRFADQADVPDTGSGQAPIVDMGAYEGLYQTFILSANRVELPEGMGTTFTVALALPPAGPLQVAVARVSGDPGVTVVDGSVLTFDASNFSVPQTVTLAAARDAGINNTTSTVEITAADVTTASVVVLKRDLFPPLFVKHDAQGANNGSSWADAFVELQSALAAAAGHPRDIWVARGTYLPDRGTRQSIGDRKASFTLPGGVGVYGGFAGNEDPATFDLQSRDLAVNRTVLSGDLAANDAPGYVNYDENSQHVVQFLAGSVHARLDGFVIAGGNADLVHGAGLACAGADLQVVHCTFQSNKSVYDTYKGGGYGAGAYVNGERATFSDCVFVNNRSGLGSGLYLDASTGSSVTHCSFETNSALGTVTSTAGGAMFAYRAGGLRVDHCTFTGNTGRALQFSNTTGQVIACVFEGNSPTAMYNWYSNPLLVGCVFRNNGGSGASGGAVYHEYGAPMLINCALVGNKAGSGAALYGSNSAPELINCTIAHNVASSRGGAYYGIASGSSPSAHARLTNCILWGNRDSTGTKETSQVYLTPAASSTATFDRCCVQGWAGAFGGVGNTGYNPQFVRNPSDGGDGWGVGNDDYGDLRLRVGSACIDAGDTPAVPPDFPDLNGNGDVEERLPFDVLGGPRLVDDPTTADTGAGVSPLADMGACEYDPQADYDEDQVANGQDNCFLVANTDQLDGDADGLGDICDNCPAAANAGQSDADNDGKGDACDNCPAIANANQADDDHDNVGNPCDNCGTAANTDQANQDGDAFGDACDNCPAITNPDQCDTDEDGPGDLCDPVPNTALSFDGVDDYITIPANAFGTNLFTVELWLRATGPGFLLDKRNSATQGFWLEVGGDGKAVFSVKMSSQAEPTSVSSGRFVADGRWHHLAAVRFGDRLAIVVDGTGYTQSIPLDTVVANPGPIVLGVNYALSLPLACSLDELRFWSLARTIQEIRSSMNAPLLGTEPGLVGYYTLEGACTQQVVRDLKQSVNGWLGTSSSTVDVRDPRWIVSGAMMPTDTDGDGILDLDDNCPEQANSGQEDSDGDLVGDACDNCQSLPNGDQYDADLDGTGDPCDDDRDGDSLPNAADNCPDQPNPDQSDGDGDRVGDACDACPDTYPGAFVDSSGCQIHIHFDFDHDADVDQEDFGHLQRCMTSPGVPQTDPVCADTVLNENGTVGQWDVARFLGCMSGPGVAGNPACLP